MSETDKISDKNPWIEKENKIIYNKIDRLEKVMSNILRRMNVYDNELQLQREDMESIKVVVSNHSEVLKNMNTVSNNIAIELDSLKNEHVRHHGLIEKSKQNIENNKSNKNKDNKINNDVVKHD